MKVVLINDQLNAGGAEKVLIYIANLLHKNNIDVSVVLLLNKSVLDDQINTQIPIHYINRQSRFSFKAFLKLKQLVKDADIVHIHSRYNLRYYMLARLIVNIQKPKIFFHEHVPSFKIDAFTKYLIQHVDAYVAVQDKMREWAVSNKMIAKQKAFYLANTVSPPATVSNKNAESKEGKILMVANFREIKNQTFAVTLLSKLPESFTLDIYGTIDEVDYFNKVEKTIQSLSLENRVHIYRGVTNIYERLSNYKFAIHTAIGETGPLVLVEYLHAGLPFLTYDTGDVVSILKKYLPQFIIDNFNEAEWLSKVQAFNQQDNIEEERAKMQLMIKEHFSEEAYFSQLISIYQQLLS